MKNSDKDDYKVCFSGATKSNREANKAGVALLFGFIGIVTIGLVIGIQNKLTIFIISVIMGCIGYFGIANRLLINKGRSEKEDGGAFGMTPKGSDVLHRMFLHPLP